MATTRDTIPADMLETLSDLWTEFMSIPIEDKAARKAAAKKFWDLVPPAGHPRYLHHVDFLIEKKSGIVPSLPAGTYSDANVTPVLERLAHPDCATEMVIPIFQAFPQLKDNPKSCSTTLWRMAGVHSFGTNVKLLLAQAFPGRCVKRTEFDALVKTLPASWSTDDMVAFFTNLMGWAKPDGDPTKSLQMADWLIEHPCFQPGNGGPLRASHLLGVLKKMRDDAGGHAVKCPRTGTVKFSLDNPPYPEVTTSFVATFLRRFGTASASTLQQALDDNTPLVKCDGYDDVLPGDEDSAKKKKKEEEEAQKKKKEEDDKKDDKESKSGDDGAEETKADPADDDDDDDDDDEEEEEEEEEDPEQVTALYKILLGDDGKLTTEDLMYGALAALPRFDYDPDHIHFTQWVKAGATQPRPSNVYYGPARVDTRLREFMLCHMLRSDDPKVVANVTPDVVDKFNALHTTKMVVRANTLETSILMASILARNYAVAWHLATTMQFGNCEAVKSPSGQPTTPFAAVRFVLESGDLGHVPCPTLSAPDQEDPAKAVVSVCQSATVDQIRFQHHLMKTSRLMRGLKEAQAHWFTSALRQRSASLVAEVRKAMDDDGGKSVGDRGVEESKSSGSSGAGGGSGGGGGTDKTMPLIIENWKKLILELLSSFGAVTDTSDVRWLGTLGIVPSNVMFSKSWFASSSFNPNMTVNNIPVMDLAMAWSPPWFEYVLKILASPAFEPMMQSSVASTRWQRLLDATYTNTSQKLNVLRAYLMTGPDIPGNVTAKLESLGIDAHARVQPLVRSLRKRVHLLESKATSANQQLNDRRVGEANLKARLATMDTKLKELTAIATAAKEAAATAAAAAAAATAAAAEASAEAAAATTAAAASDATDSPAAAADSSQDDTDKEEEEEEGEDAAGAAGGATDSTTTTSTTTTTTTKKKKKKKARKGKRGAGQSPSTKPNNDAAVATEDSASISDSSSDDEAVAGGGG